MSAQSEQFLTLARKLVHDVNPMVLKAVAAGSRDSVSKTDGSLVTNTDHAVEEHFVRELEAAFPTTPILGEEMATGAHPAVIAGAIDCYSTFMRSPQQIVIDPIDGTKNFVEGRPEFCIAAALTSSVEGGIWPLVSVVALPCAGVMYWCDRDAAFCENITTGEVSRISRSEADTGRVSVNSKDRAWLAEHSFSIERPWVSSGSSVYDFMGTACGALRGSLVGAQRLWDLMAPLAIAERLGCVLRDIMTGEQICRIAPDDLSPDLEGRPWGLVRKMAILPQHGRLEDLFRSLPKGATP